MKVQWQVIRVSGHSCSRLIELLCQALARGPQTWVRNLVNSESTLVTPQKRGTIFRVDYLEAIREQEWHGGRAFC